jgi:uncharacterized protein
MNIMTLLKGLTIALVIIGALNWGLVGAFHFNLVTTLFGDLSVVTRMIYILVGLAGIYKLFLLLKK